MIEQKETLSIESAVTHLFDEEIYLTGIKEFGLSWEELTSGKAVIPLSGARFEIGFEGYVRGEDIKGNIKGVDYLEVRADGKFMLTIHGSIITHDGELITVEENGISVPNETGIAKLFLNMKFQTASTLYDWINKKQVWAVGEVDMKNGVVIMKGYSN